MAVLSIAALFGMGAVTAKADYLFDICPSGLSGIATLVTSCPFADVVRASWYASPGSVVDAYSPVTGRLYVMFCNSQQLVRFNGGGQRLAVRCDGGTDAVVVFW